MTGQDLKNSILQLAIQGKLVPQDANDEPASVLLERIKAEKQKLFNEKKIKKEKPLPEITEDEKPFEIPEGWVWCRLGDLFLHASGKQQSSSNKDAGTPQKFITTSNLYWGRFELENVKTMNFTDEEIARCSATKGDLLVCEGGAGYGRSAIWYYDYDICLQNHVHRLRPCVDGTCEYVYHFIYLLKETNRLLSVGTAMPGLSANRLKGLVLPLPPLSEQHRIVAKIEELMPLVEEYDKAQKELDALNAKLPEALKKSILQEAIQGKLVPQDHNDEPASVLLQRIRKEKEQLVKDGKLKKKDLVTTPITDEEKPFEIPESWEWCRMGDISNSYIGLTYKPSDVSENGTVVLRSSNIQNGKLSLFDIVKVSLDIPEKLRVRESDILICARNGSQKLVGKSALVTKEAEGMTFGAFMAICKTLFYAYVFRFLQSDLFFSQLREVSGTTTINQLTQKNFNNFLIPLPPLSEQHRIVSKIEDLFAQIEPLAKALSTPM